MAPRDEINFEKFHRDELPRRISAGNGPEAYTATSSLGPLTFRTEDGTAFTYLPRHGSIEVIEGALDGATRVEIKRSDFSDLVQELAAAAGLFYPGRVHVTHGESRRFLDWEPGWRALFSGRPVFPNDGVDLRDRSGAPLDPQRSFHIDEDRDEMRHFVKTAGYLHIRAAFTSAEVDDLRGAAATLATQATEEDGNSWWGLDSKGDKHLTRILDARHNTRLHRLVDDRRLSTLVDLVDPELAPDLQGEAVTVLYKVKDIVEGLANLPWHRDCGMGGHAIQCPTVNVSLFLTPCNRETGGLWMLPGSAPYSCPPDLFREDEPSGSILVEAEPGDVTLHLSDTMHAAFPPTGEGAMRESLVLTWKPPGARPHDGQSHYNDAVKGDGGVPVAGKAAPKPQGQN